MASNNLFTILLDSVIDKYSQLSMADQQVKVMELLKEQLMASQINDSHSEGTLYLAGESQYPYEDDDNMSIVSSNKSTEASIEGFLMH